MRRSRRVPAKFSRQDTINQTAAALGHLQRNGLKGRGEYIDDYGNRVVVNKRGGVTLDMKDGRKGNKRMRYTSMPNGRVRVTGGVPFVSDVDKARGALMRFGTPWPLDQPERKRTRRRR